MLSAPALPRRRLRRRYQPAAWLLARVRASWIDRELAQGVALCSSQRLGSAVRSRQGSSVWSSTPSARPALAESPR
jgi:hypothetical protein